MSWLITTSGAPSLTRTKFPSFTNKATDSPAYRRIDVAVAELNFGIVDSGFIRVDDRLGGIRVGLDLIVLLAGDILFVQQLSVTPNLFAQVFQLRVIAGQIGFGLLERRVERTRINGKEQLVFFYILALL